MPYAACLYEIVLHRVMDRAAAAYSRGPQYVSRSRLHLSHRDVVRGPRRFFLLALVIGVPLLFAVTSASFAPWDIAPVAIPTGSSNLAADCIPCPTPPGGCYNSVSDCLGVDPSGSPQTGQAPLTVSFSETLYNGLGGYTYSWTFGDGGTSTAAHPTHTYSSAGSYVAGLTVTESGGYHSSGSTVITASCATSEIQGTIDIAGTSTGIYGATVALALGESATTSSTGAYSMNLGCTSTTSSTEQVSAPGYTASGAVSVSWTKGTTSTLPTIYLGIVSTNLLESQSTWFNVTKCLASGCASLAPSPYSDLNVTSYSVQTESSCTTCGTIPAPPSGDPTSQVLVFKGTDTSDAMTPGHPQNGYLLESIMTVPGTGGFPLSSAMVLAFNIYVVSAGCMVCGTPYNLENFTVDLEFTDGTILSTLLDSTGSPILDGNGTQIGYDWWEMYPGNWVRMAFDLSEVRDKSVKAIMLDYETHGGGSCGNALNICSGAFEVAFDNIRFEMPHYSTSIADGGFELPQLDGWSVAGNLPPQLESSVALGGTQSVLLGSTTCPTPVGNHGSCIDYYTILIQPFRIPNSVPALTLQFTVELGNWGGSNDFQRIWLNDRTTLTDIYLLGSATSGPLSTNGAVTYTPSVTAYEGHIVWLEIEVAHNTGTTQGDWMYLDNVALVPTGVSLSESAFTPSSSGTSASESYAGTMTFPASPYASGTSYQQNLPMGVGAGLQHVPGCVGSGGCTGLDAAALALDFSSESPSYDYCTVACNANTWWLDLSAFADTDAVIPTNQGPVGVGISQITMTVSLSTFGGTTGPTTLTAGNEYVENLEPGHLVTQSSPPSNWDLVIGGIGVALAFLLPGIGEAADLGVVELAAIGGGSDLGLHALQWAIDSTPVVSVSGNGGSCSGGSCQFTWSSTSGADEAGATNLVSLTTAAGAGDWSLIVGMTASYEWEGSSFDTISTEYILNLEVL